MSDEYFLAGPDGTLGPFSKKNLQKLLENGRISPDVQCWLAGNFNAKASVESILGKEVGKTSLSNRLINKKKTKKNNLSHIFIPDIRAFDNFLSNKSLIKNFIGMLISSLALLSGIACILSFFVLSYLAKNATLSAALSMMMYPTYLFFTSIFFGGLKIRNLNEDDFEVIPIVVELFDVLAKAIAMFFAFSAPSVGIFSFEYHKLNAFENGIIYPILMGILFAAGACVYAVILFIFLKGMKEFTMIIFSIAANVAQIKKQLANNGASGGNDK